MMKVHLFRSLAVLPALAALALGFSGCATDAAGGKAAAGGSGMPKVVIATSMGDITVELDAARAPLTVTNFLRYVDEGFYDRTIIHRVEPSSLIEAGAFDVLYNAKKTHPSIPNEADNGLVNRRGTIAMARGKAKSSATSRFFINLDDHPSFDHVPEDPRRFGYAVFGRVTRGLSVADKISKVPVKPAHGMRETPAEVVAVKTIRRVE